MCKIQPLAGLTGCGIEGVCRVIPSFGRTSTRSWRELPEPGAALVVEPQQVVLGQADSPLIVAPQAPWNDNGQACVLRCRDFAGSRTSAAIMPSNATRAASAKGCANAAASLTAPSVRPSAAMLMAKPVWRTMNVTAEAMPACVDGASSRTTPDS